MSFDLDAYFARIRLADSPACDLDGLATIQRAQRLAIPFENLDIRLGRGIAIDGEAVFDKLVTRRRGGYCFEQNRLLCDALTALGFSVRPLLARVWFGATTTPGRTHMLLLVTIDGREWIADAGFGGSYSPVMPLVEDAEATAPDGALYRLIRDDRGWVLLRDGNPATTDGRDEGAGWVEQYSFTLDEVPAIDFQMSNHWTATAPGTRFTDLVVVSIVLPHGFAALTDRDYRRHSAGEDTLGTIDDPRVYRMRLSLMFGIDLTEEEVVRLGLFEATGGN